MSGWDIGEVYISNAEGRPEASTKATTEHLGRKFGDFIRNFKDKNTFPYRYEGLLVMLTFFQEISYDRTASCVNTTWKLV